VGRDAFFEWNLKGEIFWAEHTAIVGKVGAEAPLSRAGLRPGDIVQTVNGEACYSPQDFATLLPKADLGAPQPVLVTALRDGETVSIEVAAQSLRDSEGVTWEAMARVDPTRGGPAEKVGILPGAKVVTLGGKRLYSWADLVRAVQGIDPDTTTEIGWVSATGEEKKGHITVGLEPVAVGLPIKPLEKTLRVNALESIGVGANRIALTAKQIFLTLRSLIRREVSAKNLSGPVGITHLLTKVAEQNNLATLLYWLALISVNLGIFNLLPFPILDGGHLLFLAIEKVKGSPVSVIVQDWAMRVAFLLIIFLAVFVTFNDLKRLLG
jgi:regulator of sigma E protease